MEQASRKEIEMKQLMVIWLFLFATYGHSSEDSSYFQLRNLNGADEQRVFNIMKKIFRHNGDTYIVDTTWDRLEIIQRSIKGYLDVDVITEHIVLTYEADEQYFRLELFTQAGDEKELYSDTHAIYNLIWNRLEYALEINDTWESCFTLRLNNLAYPLCKIDKEALKRL